MMRGVPLLRQWMRATVMMVALKNRTCRTMAAKEVAMAMAATASWSYFWTQSLVARSQLERMRVTRWLLASGRRFSILTWAAVMRHLAVMATCTHVPDAVVLPAVPVTGAAPRGPRRAPPAAAATILGGRMCHHESYGRFTAECGNEFHENCVVSRQNTAAARRKGRP